MAFVFEEIPSYLKVHTVEQRPELYTPIDHASWRFIMKLAKDFFPAHAHEKYLKGLEETGISTESIPLISDMDAKLRRFGWRAVAVSGFIAPSAFMEFLALGVLPIACDMRSLEHLAYTPAPDIVHEAAGHAPIIADAEYAEYLRSYGELARRAIYSAEDMEVYNAIRELSEVKEDPRSTAAQVATTEKRLIAAVAATTRVSEATQLSRMGWWTFEYGLVGEFSNPKIYGAGLLSSVGESYRCLGPEVKKIPFSLACIETNYDITRPQPQLFVASDFQVLKNALDELASRMSYKKGGIYGLTQATESGTLTTTVLEGGLQISGVLQEFRLDSKGAPAFLKFSGPCQLSVEDREIKGQGTKDHAHGFSTPLGKIKGTGKTCAELSSEDFKNLGFRNSEPGFLHFESGVEVSAVLFDQLQLNGKNLILRFKDCTMKLKDEVLYQPEWGVFDLACGSQVISVFGGAADRAAYEASKHTKFKGREAKTNLTESNRRLNELYASVRKLREEEGENLALLEDIISEHSQKYPRDWLLKLEILELLVESKNSEAAKFHRSLFENLEALSKESEQAELIERGIKVLNVSP